MTGRERFRKLRTALEVPILTEKYWAKVPDLKTDAIMIDLEDSAPPAAKDEARRRALAAIGDAAHLGGRIPVVRVNNLATEWGRADLDMLAGTDADVLVCYPKAESASELADVVASIRADRPDRVVWAMIESCRGVIALPEIIRVDGLAGLHFGYTDYCAELGLSPFDAAGTALGPAASFAAHAVAVAAAAGGLFVTGGSLVPDFRNLAKVETFLTGWVTSGYTSCLVLSPAHLAVAAQVFSPSEATIADAISGIAAFDEASAAGLANARVGDRIITLPEYRRLQAVVAGARHGARR